MLSLNLAWVLSQNQCFNIDSVKVCYVPLKLSTTLSLSAIDVKNFEPSSYRKKVLIDDQRVIKLFSDIDLFKADLIKEEKSNWKSVDTRIVLEIFYKEGLVSTMSIDSYGYYLFFNKLYSRNEDLVSWIEKYILKEKWE